MADPLFQVGDSVTSWREPRLRMTVGAVGIEERAGRMYQCVVDDEHAPNHRRGKSTRWWRESDLRAVEALPEEVTAQEQIDELADRLEKTMEKLEKASSDAA